MTHLQTRCRATTRTVRCGSRSQPWDICWNAREKRTTPDGVDPGNQSATSRSWNCRWSSGKTVSIGSSCSEFTRWAIPQFAEFIDARGLNTQINSACASTTQALALAEDWIHEGRCRRVIVISADDATSDHSMEWIGARDSWLRERRQPMTWWKMPALPFDRRRHGLIVGMGAAAFVVEDAKLARERGIQPICEVLGTVTANSAFHGSRLDVRHICEVMGRLVSDVESKFGLIATKFRKTWSLFRMRPTRQPAAAAPRRRSMRSVKSSEHPQIAL